ncbi:prepilin peptidase [Bacillus timonensis]|nr:prepilin peptidase [Bacillus timonensis]
MLTVTIHLILFIYGIILGSFFNVVGLRVPQKRSILYPRSACPNCRHQLSALELIPVFSYIFQKGVCRKCALKISPIYPAVELTTGILFGLAFYIVGFVPELLVALTLISLLMIIFVSDINYMLIPDKVLLFFAPLFLIERIFIPLNPWWDILLGGIVGFCLLLLIAIISKGGMGGGDIKLYGVLGFALGWKIVLLSFFFSTIFGTIFGIIGMIIGKVERGKPMPFGPAIVCGTLLAYFYGNDIITWYLSFVLS